MAGLFYLRDEGRILKMPEGRMLKKQISISRTLPELKSDSARLLYTWLIPHLDVEGRFSADPDVVKGHVVPRLKMTKKKIWDYLQDMAEKGLIILYEADGDYYLEFTVFEKHQIIRKDREADSKIPSPKEGSIITSELLQSYSRVTPENSSTSKVKESKVKLNKEKVKKDSSLFEIEFKEFWDLYPRKTQKQDAKETFMVRCRQGLSSDIIKALKGYLKFLKYQRIQNNFDQAPMYPKTFLNKNRWKEFINFEYKEPGQRISKQTPKEQNYWKDREKKIAGLAKKGLNENEIQIEISKWSKKYWEEQPNEK